MQVVAAKVSSWVVALGGPHLNPFRSTTELWNGFG